MTPDSAKYFSSRTAVRLAVWSALVLAVLLAVAGTGLLILDTPYGKRQLTSWLNGELGDDTSGIEIGTVTGTLFGKFRIDRVRFKDTEGVWAELHATEVIWSPWKLVGGTLDIESLHAKRLNVRRRPASRNEAADMQVPSSSPLAVPELPFDLRIGEFDLAEINLRRAVAGRPMQLTSHGQLVEEEDRRITLGFFLQRRGDIREELALDLIFDKVDDYLALDGKLYIPPRGLIAALTGTTLDQDFSLQLQGEGPRSNWAGKFAVLQGEVLLGEASITNRNHVFSIAADIDPGLQKNLKDVEMLGGNIGLSVLLKPDAEEYHKYLTVEMETATAAIRAEGRLNTKDITLLDNIRYSGRLKHETAFGNVKFSPFTVQGVISGTLSEPAFTLKSDSLAVQTNDGTRLRVTGTLSANRTDSALRYTTAGTVTEFALGSADQPPVYLPLPVYWRGDGQLDLAGNLAVLDSLELKNEPSQLTLSGSVGLGGDSLDLAGRLRSSLAPLGEALSGTMALDLSAKRENGGEPLLLDINASSQDISYGSPLLDNLTGPAPTARVSGTLRPDDSLSVTAEIAGSHVSLSADLTADKNMLLQDSSYTLSLIDLNTMEKAGGLSLAGKLDISGVLSGPLASPDMTAETSLKNLDIQGITLTDLALSANLRNIVNSLQGMVTLTGSSGYGPLDLSFTVAQPEKDIFRLSEISALAGPLMATGDLSIPSGKALNGEISLQTLPEKERAASVSDLFEGTLEAALSLEDRNGQQQYSSSGTARDLRITLPGGDILTLRQTDWSGQLLTDDDLPALDLSASAKDLSLPRIELSELKINLDHDDRKTAFRIDAGGTELYPLELSARGHVETGSGKSLELELSLDGQANNIGFNTPAPLHFEKTGDSLSLSPAKLSLGDGTLGVSFSRTPEDIKAHVKADQADLRLLNQFIPELPFTGTADGRIDLSASSKALKGTALLTLTGLDTPQQLYAIDPDLKIGINAILSEQQISLTGRVDLAATKLAGLSATLPVDYNFGGGDYSIDTQSPLSADLDWDGRVEPLWPMLNLFNHDLSGAASGRIAVTGSLNEPHFSGKIGFDNGRYENIQSGFVADNMELDAEVSDNRLTLRKFTATDGGSGTLGADGWIQVFPDLSYQADINLRADRAHLYRQPSLEITASTELSLKKDEERLTLDGEAEVNSANINLVDQGPGNLIETDVVEINNGRPVIEDEDLKKRHIGPLYLDLALKAPKRVFVRGRGLDSEWAGDLDITGSSDEVIINGSISLIKGTFSFSGKRFNLTHGEIRFPGNQSNDPSLNIVAQLDMVNLTAFIKIGGTAAQPALTITSSPELPQDEIMARILFGSSVTELTPWQALQLASSIQALSGSGGPGMLDKMRGSIGIDRFSIASDANGQHGTLISGGKYLTDKIYVEITTSSTSGATAQSVEVDLTKSLSLVTRHTLDQDNSLSIRWSWDY
ncbi:translocation/assembly module TamB domain-containing protein [Emcibacter sp.]|uniref:translocation/assembly module TamB domain-containing protein n=1 Tax=Emcibacter sp. TaxID=1979954 RepID=UPI003A95C3BD